MRETVVSVSLAHEIVEAHQATITAGRSALEHARRAGELLIQAKALCGHGEWLPWLAANVPTISETTVQGYMRVAKGWSKLDVAAKAQRVADLPLRDALKLLVGPRETHNSGDFEWYSPPEYVEAARLVMGDIDLDPMSSAAANAVVRAATFYDIATDGLQQPWAGRLWANPPYKNAIMTAFAARLLEHHDRGDVREAIVLTNNATETAWFHALASAAISICFKRGRAHFWRADTPELSSSSPLQGQVIFYFGPHADRFAEVFGALGLIMALACRPADRSAVVPRDVQKKAIEMGVRTTSGQHCTKRVQIAKTLRKVAGQGRKSCPADKRPSEAANTRGLHFFATDKPL